MSGRGSRARRVAAVKAARASVYANNGRRYAEKYNPFTEDRQRRIFAKAYESLRVAFWDNERRLAELLQVYGGAA